MVYGGKERSQLQAWKLSPIDGSRGGGAARMDGIRAMDGEGLDKQARRQDSKSQRKSGAEKSQQNDQKVVEKERLEY